MAIVVRPYEDARDREAFTQILSLVYRSGEPWKGEDKVLEEGEETAHVAELDGQVVAGFFIADMSCTRGKVELKAGGIAGVAVRPDARRTGVAGEMMRYAIRKMRADGCVVSHLYAFRESFYRKFGWEVAGCRLKITCPQHRLPNVPSRLPARLIPQGGWPEIAGVYEAFASRYSGMNRRSDRQWKQVTEGTGGRTRLYAIGDPAQAYAVVHVSNQFWEEQMVSEVAWASREGYESLAAFLSSLASNKTALAWYEPSDSPFLAKFVDQGVKFSLERPVMYRAVDVPAALAALPGPNGSGSFSIEVHDEVVPENRGPWLVTFDHGKATVAKTKQAGMQMHVREFSQALMGEPSLADLASHGLVEGVTDAALAHLTPQRTYCMDFF